MRIVSRVRGASTDGSEREGRREREKLESPAPWDREQEEEDRRNIARDFHPIGEHRILAPARGAGGYEGGLEIVNNWIVNFWWLCITREWQMFR